MNKKKFQVTKSKRSFGNNLQRTEFNIRDVRFSDSFYVFGTQIFLHFDCFPRFAFHFVFEYSKENFYAISQNHNVQITFKYMYTA